MKFVGTSETKLGEKLKEERKVSGKKPKKKNQTQGRCRPGTTKITLKWKKKIKK